MNIELTASVVSAYIDNHIFLLSMLTAILFSELVLRTYLSTIRARFNSAQKGLTDDTEIEKVSLEYYSKKQRVILARSFIILLAFIFGVLYYDIRSFGFLAVAIGAIIMTFKETVVSAISYFYVLRNYKIGDDIKIAGIRGEILNIRPTYTTILGKEDDSENNARVTIVQNYRFVTDPVERLGMRTNDYLLASISIPYEPKHFDIPFDEMLSEVKKFLDGMLPMRGFNNVGFYRSYAGYKYKINFHYDGDARVVLDISFVTKPRRIVDRKEKIVVFVESLKKK